MYHFFLSIFLKYIKVLLVPTKYEDGDLNFQILIWGKEIQEETFNLKLSL